MPALVTCSRCGDLYSESSALCPTCGTRRSGAEAVVSRPGEPGEPAMTAVVVKDFDMPFGSMVSFMVKWAIAAIPAFIILVAIGWAASFLLGILPFHWFGSGHGVV